MNDRIRRQIDMATRARDFTRAHPSSEASYAAVLARLEDRVAKAETLVAQQRTGQIAVHASTARRKELRRTLHEHLLGHLARVGAEVEKEQPELIKSFQRPANNVSSLTLRAAARTMLEQAKAHRELFVRLGMAETLLDELAAALTEFEAAEDQGRAGRESHVAARADLAAVARELMSLVKLLDGINRYRFRADPALMAAWDSARNPGYPNRSASEPEKDSAAPAA